MLVFSLNTSSGKLVRIPQPRRVPDQSLKAVPACSDSLREAGGQLPSYGDDNRSHALAVICKHDLVRIYEVRIQATLFGMMIADF